ncbi:MAG TPA: ABC transporter ATP-binding protein [Candidatus Paceibacterota bacterium]|nr:ABC transporter ATP-binding protein [Candidatus Paceibacterota bacterium]
MEPIIQVKGIGKRYDIRHYQGKYVALRDVLMTVIKSPLRFFKEKAKAVTGIGAKEAFWALKEVSFNINAGEVVGVIGRNGAGKSTLLKILTGITPPTTGEIVMRGRVGSLLEVGTGFHPELTGRENIFLNGAILGMTRKQIAQNFDKIVEFAGIERFLDTPVKYYSSGMYVRLAFSVAAHLEPDILLVDEVLAVGDAEFQKKCLGKMEEVTSRDGRTILFVSHNMAAIQSLCKKCILMEKGQVKMVGETDEVIRQYLKGAESRGTEAFWKKEDRPGNSVARLDSVRLVDAGSKSIPYAFSNQAIGVEISYEVLEEGRMPLPNIHLFTSKGECAFVSVADHSDRLDRKGPHKAIAWIPANILNNETYSVNVAISTVRPLHIHANVPDAIAFRVLEDIDKASENDYNERLPGAVRPRLKWTSA